RFLAVVVMAIIGVLGAAGVLATRFLHSQPKPERAANPAVATPTGENGQQRPMAPAVDSVSSISDHAGWFGSVGVPGMVLAIAEIPPDSPAAAVYKSQYPGAAGFLQVSAHNRSEVPITIDLSHAELVKADNTHVAGPDRNSVLATATGKKELLQARHSAPY